MSGVDSSFNEDFFAFAGDEGVAIYDDNLNLSYFLRTEFECKKVLYSENDNWLIILDKEGNIRVIDWKQGEETLKIDEHAIFDAVSARNGEIFAVNNFEGKVNIYDS